MHDKRTTTTTDVWLTPREVLVALGPFDLDPAAPKRRPWDMAKIHYTVETDGLSRPWFGRVWLNPPYGRQTHLWLGRLRQHGNGIALLSTRVETRMFFEHVWGVADAIFFFRGRIQFFREDGTRCGSACAPSCLIAYGKNNVAAIRRSNLQGWLISAKEHSCVPTTATSSAS